MEPKKRILIIEDDEFIRELYQEELTRVGYQVDVLGSGKNGIATLEQNHYDLLLLDIMLPDSNGLDLLREIRSKPSIANLKVVVLTNLGQDDAVRQSFALGVVGYLIKVSYNPDQIVKEVIDYLNGKVSHEPLPQH